MPKFTKFIYATISLWLVTTLLIYTTGYGEAIQVLRGFTLTGFLTGTTSSMTRPAKSRARSVLPMVIS